MTTTRPDLDSASAVLGFARDRRAVADRAEADVLYAAVTWAEQHPPESIDEAATWVCGGGDTGLPLAGPGAPLVAEFCIAEFAAAIGRSTDSGRALIADALELKYRLPRLWTGSGPVSCRCGGPAGSPKPPWGCPWRPQGSWTPRSPGSPTRSASPHSTGWSPRRSPGTCPTSPCRTPNSCRGAALHHSPPAGLLRRHQPHRGRARPRRCPGPRRRPDPRSRNPQSRRVHRVAGRTPLDRRRRARPTPARPRPQHHHPREPPGRRPPEDGEASPGRALRAPLRSSRHRQHQHRP